MVNDAKGHWIGIGVGDVDDPKMARTAPNWNAITLLTDKLARNFTWARNMGIVKQPNYTELVAQAVERYVTDKTINIPVVRDPNGFAVANLAMRTRLGSFPPPPPPTHALFTIRGTGGIIGQDYTSQIPQALPGIYHEHPINYAAGMGGLPVGAATDPSAPSGNECAEQACQILTDAVMGSTVTFACAAYSLGSKGLTLFLNNLFDPNHSLYQHRNRLVCVVFVADPWRPFGKSFYLGPIASGQGIGTPYFTMSKAAQDGLGYRCCWLVNPSDLYTNSPLGGTGQVLADVEEMILSMSVSDPMGTMMRAIQMLLQLVVKDGGLIPGTGGVVNQPVIVSGGAGGGGGGASSGGLLGGLLGGGGGGGLLGGLGGLLGGGGGGGSLLTSVAAGSTLVTPGIAGLILPLLLGSFEGLIDGISGNGTNLPAGPAADTQAAILALKFFGAGTGPHLAYHATPWGIGPQTFLQLGIQHAADWGSRTPVLT